MKYVAPHMKHHLLLPRLAQQRNPTTMTRIAPELSIAGLLTLHADGSVTRFSPSDGGELLPACSSPSNGSASKDLILDPKTNLWIRLFFPSKSPNIKLPLLLFFHGGGFVSLSAATPGAHRFCSELAAKAPAIVVSVNYRLAPEHRLPAAFDDCFFALKWLQKQAAASNSDLADSWLSSHADYSRCFLAGMSSGGAIVHQVALMAARSDLAPLNLRGLVLVVPFFGGESRTMSELELENSETLPLSGSDICWALSLPEGADRDHPFCNVLCTQAPKVDSLEWPPALVVVGGKDILHDRQLQYVEMLQSAGKEVKLVRYEQGDHFMSGELYDLNMEQIIHFIHTHS